MKSRLLAVRIYRLVPPIIVTLQTGCIALAFALLSPPTAMAGDEKGLVVLPDGGSSFSGPQGREADITEILARREQTGGALGLFRQIIAPKSGPPTRSE